MNHNYNELTPGETERLALLAEECGECIHAIGKILRHGYESHDPTITRLADQITNREMLTKEIGDIEASITRMYQAGDITKGAVLAAARAKWSSVRRWLHHQPPDKPETKAP